MRKQYNFKIDSVIWLLFLMIILPLTATANEGKTASAWIMDFLISWVAPLIILLALWTFLFKRIGGFSKHMDREKAHMEKVEKLLERITAAVEQKAISKD